ncbi:hypothetical protein [Thiobacillus sp.]
MSGYVEDKSKNEILEALTSTALPGSSVHEQQKMGIIVRSAEDLEEALKNLEKSMNRNAESSSQLATKVFWLNVVLVAATATAAAFTGYDLFLRSAGQ